jgi:hypothetical protein
MGLFSLCKRKWVLQRTAPQSRGRVRNYIPSLECLEDRRLLYAMLGGTTVNVLHPAIQIPGGDADVHFSSTPSGIVTLNPDSEHIPACTGSDCATLRSAFPVSVTAGTVTHETDVNLTNVEDGSVWAFVAVCPAPGPNHPCTASDLGLPPPQPTGPRFVSNGPAVLDFGLVDEGPIQPTMSFQFTNAGTSTLNVTPRVEVSTGSIPFAGITGGLTNGVNRTNPNETHSVSVIFDTRAGDAQATLILDTNDPSAGVHGSVRIPVRGRVNPKPVLTVDQTAVDFGGVPVTQSKTLHVTASNEGHGVLQIQQVGIINSSSNPSPFAAVVHSNPTLPLSLPFGKTASIDVTFQPGQLGEYTAALQLVTNAGTKTVSLRGTGSLRSGRPVSGGFLRDGDSIRYRLDTDANANQQYNVSLVPSDKNLVPFLQVYNSAGVLLLGIDGTSNWLTGLFEIHTQLMAVPNSTFFLVAGARRGTPFGGASFKLSVSRSPVASSGSYSLAVNDWLRTDRSTGVLKFASDPDGLDMSAELISGPTNGSLDAGFNSDGSFWYSPRHFFVGTDQLTYRVRDANGQSSIATIQFNVTPLAPSAENLTYRVLGGQARAANVLTGNSDPQGLPLQAVLISPSGSPVALPLHQPLRLTHGSLTSFDATGNFVYTPDAGYRGTDSFRYAVVDSRFPFTATGTPTATVFLVIGQPPVANDVVYYATPNQTLTVSAASGLVGSPTDNPQTTTHLVGSAPQGLTLHDDGSFVYRPPTGRRRFQVTFSYYLTNPDGTSNTATVTIQVGDDPDNPDPPPPPGRRPQ